MTSGSFSTLRRFVRERPPLERCDLCSAPVGPVHPHLIEPARRRLQCSCDACAILFSGHAAARYRRVPQRVRSLRSFHLTDAQWDSLLIPISMAFFYESSVDKRVVALYPSPAGPMESLLTLEAWTEIADENPVLKEMEPDVEALLVNRLGAAHGQAAPQYYVAPIDECYKLVGLIRAEWKGLSGGADVWKGIGDFFARLKERAMYDEDVHA